MKKILIFFLVISIQNAYSENSILAIVNNYPILSSSINNELFTSASSRKKLEILNNRIDNYIQLQKATELNLQPTKQNIETVLIEIAKNNNILLDDLLKLDDLDLIIEEIKEKLSILNLQRFITKDIEKPSKQILSECSNADLERDQKQIKIAQIIISEIDTEIKNPDQENKLISAFLYKLSNHISKGASFENFAKLYSQHSSYKDGGVTGWLTVNNATLEMIDSLNVNEVSEIYSTDYGLAIAIKIDEKFISSKLKVCEERVIYKNAEMYYIQWLNNLKEQTYIEIYYDKLK